MQIVIVGAGTVGFDLAVHLQRAGHDVALVERNPARCAEIRERLDILVVEGQAHSFAARHCQSPPPPRFAIGERSPAWRAQGARPLAALAGRGLDRKALRPDRRDPYHASRA